MTDLVQRLRRCASGTRSDRMREFLVEVANYIEDLVAKERRRDGTIPRLEAELEHSRRIYRELVVTANERLATINRLSLRERELVAENERLRADLRTWKVAAEMRVDRIKLRWATKGDSLVHTLAGRRFSAEVLRTGYFAFMIGLDGPQWLRVDRATGEVLARVVPFMGIAVEEPVEREGFYPKAPEAA